MAYTLPDLPYAHNALEPHIDALTMQIHHGKHHNAYVTKLNDAINGTDLGSKSIDQLMRDIKQVPDNIRQAVINNGGGHCNHSLFWTIMGPGAGGQPSGPLGDEIKATFSDFAAFQAEFKTAATTRFGSGWAWLVLADGKLKVTSTLNQDSPFMEGQVPIIGLDVWEHAYYLKYQNKRPDYVDAWWNVVNWNAAGQRFADAKAGKL